MNMIDGVLLVVERDGRPAGGKTVLCCARPWKPAPNPSW